MYKTLFTQHSSIQFFSSFLFCSSSAIFSSPLHSFLLCLLICTIESHITWADNYFHSECHCLCKLMSVQFMRISYQYNQQHVMLCVLMYVFAKLSCSFVCVCVSGFQFISEWRSHSNPKLSSNTLLTRYEPQFPTVPPFSLPPLSLHLFPPHEDKVIWLQSEIRWISSTTDRGVYRPKRSW